MNLPRPAAMLCWHALLRAALLASAVLRAGSKPALRAAGTARASAAAAPQETTYYGLNVHVHVQRDEQLARQIRGQALHERVGADARGRRRLIGAGRALSTSGIPDI